LYLDLEDPSQYLHCGGNLVKYYVHELFDLTMAVAVACHVSRVTNIVFHGTCKTQQASSNRCFVKIEVKVKVKFTLEQSRKAQRGSRGIALLLL
jgi:hypothetical protein